MSGQIAGTMEQYPDTAELARHGFHVLVDVTDIAGDYPNTSYVTSRAFLKKQAGGGEEILDGDGDRRARVQDATRESRSR